MELKNTRELEKLNAKIDELKEKLKTATLDEEREIEEEIYSLESRKEQMLAFVNQNVEDIDEDF